MKKLFIAIALVVTVMVTSCGPKVKPVETEEAIVEETVQVDSTTVTTTEVIETPAI